MTSAFNPEAAQATLQVLAEDLSVSRRQVEGDTVRVSTVTREVERLIDEPLTHERVEIERVAIDRQVDTAPPVRQEGDTTILSVVDEEIVVQRRLVLKEEVRIRRVRVPVRHQETVMLREQDALITREAGPPAGEDDRRLLAANPPKLAQEQQR